MINSKHIGSKFEDFLKEEGIDLNEPKQNEKPQITKIEFFKQTLQSFLDLKARNDKYDKMANEILDNEMTHDFPVYLSDNFCYPYESLVIKSLSQLWNEPEYVEDWINYLIYEAMEMENGGRAIDTKNNKEYIIKDVDSLCVYLLDYYKIGE